MAEDIYFSKRKADSDKQKQAASYTEKIDSDCISHLLPSFFLLVFRLFR